MDKSSMIFKSISKKLQRMTNTCNGLNKITLN